MALQLQDIHHVAIICSDYERSKKFYVDVLGCEIIEENHRPERDSYKLDLSIGKNGRIELFSFPNPPKRISRPEAAGLRHLAFEVLDISEQVQRLAQYGVAAEPIRVDEYTGKKFAFFFDPDGLPLELYER